MSEGNVWVSGFMPPVKDGPVRDRDCNVMDLRNRNIEVDRRKFTLPRELNQVANTHGLVVVEVLGCPFAEARVAEVLQVRHWGL
jgi:hypothetical protein